MRCLLLAGFLLFVMPGFSFAQAKGEVESIGFQNAYRPDCWTPMIVRIRPETNEAGTYQLQVWQHDLDGDRPIYTRSITLNGMDQARDQRFWMYFLPQPINKGLPDQTNNGTLKDLQHDLQVFLCTASGKQITELPITNTITNIDPFRDDYSQNPRGKKLILAVTDGSSQIAWRDYQSAVGMTETVEVVSLGTKDLPEDPIGYEAVDGIIWLDSDPANLDSAGEHKLAALQDYVRGGGQLVICQPTVDWQKTLNFNEMLPVTIQGTADKSDLEPLKSMARPNGGEPFPLRTNSWDRPTGPFRFARATAKPKAVVERWIDWKGDGSYSDATPYLVRSAFGFGQVAWVANNLGDPALVGKATTGWPYVWDKVFGWKNDTYVLPQSAKEDDDSVKPRLDLYARGGPVDLGAPLTRGLSSGSEGAWLIFVAVAFFIVYWVVAGPGGYFYLLAKKRAGFSWFFFGAAAIAATLLTVVVVKLVLRGPPKLHHLTVVRIVPNQPAMVYTRFGLYIKHDGDQSLELSEVAPEGVSYVSNFAEHPQFLADATEFPAPMDYSIPVRDTGNTDPPAITVPYRSSEKRFQARWTGQLPMRITGSVKATVPINAVKLTGILTNSTGQDLHDIFLAYHTLDDNDDLAYIPNWPKDGKIDLDKDLNSHWFAGQSGRTQRTAAPGENKIILSEIGDNRLHSNTADRTDHWVGQWFGNFHRGGMQEINFDDPKFLQALPMLSLFERIAPRWNAVEPNSNHLTDDRVELFRRGGRMLDASQCVTAGQLVIMTAVPGPMPIPLQINGDTMGGDGTILFQFLLPIDRGDLDKPPVPTTQSER